jgi:hypothetical protein
MRKRGRQEKRFSEQVLSFLAFLMNPSGPLRLKFLWLRRGRAGAFAFSNAFWLRPAALEGPAQFLRRR